MQLIDCARSFEAGHLREANIVPAVGVKGWYLQLSQTRSLDKVIVQRQRGGECVYKSLDAAFKAAYKIGFREATVQHSGNMLDYL